MDSLCELVFAVLHAKSLLKRGLLVEAFFPYEVNIYPLQKERKYSFYRAASPISVSIPLFEPGQSVSYKIAYAQQRRRPTAHAHYQIRLQSAWRRFKSLAVYTAPCEDWSNFAAACVFAEIWYTILEQKMVDFHQLALTFRQITDT